MDYKVMRDHLFFMRRNVAQGENSIAWQKQVIGEMARAGRDTSKAETLLSQFRETHDRNLSYRDRLEVELAHADVSSKKEDKS